MSDNAPHRPFSFRKGDEAHFNYVANQRKAEYPSTVLGFFRNTFSSLCEELERPADSFRSSAIVIMPPPFSLKFVERRVGDNKTFPTSRRLEEPPGHGFEVDSILYDSRLPAVVSEFLALLDHPVIKQPLNYTLQEWQKSPLKEAIRSASSTDRPKHYFLFPLWRGVAGQKPFLILLHKRKDMIFSITTHLKEKLANEREGTETYTYHEYTVRAGSIVGEKTTTVLKFLGCFYSPYEQPRWDELIHEIREVLLSMTQFPPPSPKKLARLVIVEPKVVLGRDGN